MNQMLETHLALNFADGTASHTYNRVIRRGKRSVTKEEVEEWIEDLRQLGERGEYFFVP